LHSKNKRRKDLKEILPLNPSYQTPLNLTVSNHGAKQEDQEHAGTPFPRKRERKT
jgi:hypothetical protein